MIGNLQRVQLRAMFSDAHLQALLDAEGRILELNEPLLEFLGQSRDTLLNTPFVSLFETHLVKESLHTVKGALLEAANGHPAQVSLKQTDQSDLTLSVKLISDATTAAQLLFVELDETARFGSLPSRALGDLPVGVLKQEVDGTLSLYNRAAQRMLGLSREQLTGLTPPSPHLKISYDDGTPFFENAWPQNLRSELDDPPINLLLKVERPLHETKWLLMTTEIVEQNLDTGSYASLSTLTDISEQRKREEALRQGALYDPLTSLPMRALFAERLTQVIGKAKRVPRYCFAVLFVALDDFAGVGDVLDRPGNDVLIQVATQLKESLRSSDTLARLSEGEFVILLDDAVILADAVEVAERSLSVLSTCQANELSLSASIGVFIGDKTCSSPYQVLNNARQAMLEAKDAGRGRYAIHRK